MSFSVWDYVNPLDIDKLRREFRESTPTHLICIEDFLEREFAEAVADSYPSYGEAQSHGREFKWVNERVKVQITKNQSMPEPVQTLNRIFADPEFLDVVGQVTQIQPLVADPGLAGAGMHIMGRGGSLGVHTDFTMLDSGLHRRLNILVYLNREWKDEWDGSFEVWDPPVKERLHRFTPDFNRCVLFNTTRDSFHAVSALRCPREINRISFAAYYYTEEPPDGWDGIARNTIYKARPEEWWKGYVQMPLEEFRKPIERRLRKAYYKLRGRDWPTSVSRED